MYDTIECTTELDYELSPDLFVSHSVYATGLGESAKMLVARERGVYEPGVVYRHNRQKSRSRVVVSFSVPKMIPGHDECVNVNEADLTIALLRVNAYLHEKIGLVTDVREWKITRMDYAWNYDVGKDRLGYIRMMQKLSFPRKDTHIYGSTGVSWYRSKRGRSVKFYDKSIEQGRRDTSVLRYEVSNFSPAVRYLAQNWFGCDQTVHEFVQPGRAFAVLAYCWRKLGLNADSVYRQGDSLHTALRAKYGSGAMTALWVLETHESYGVDAYKEDLLAQATYYTWLKRLRADGFVSTSGSTLPVLDLPLAETIERLSQNLEDFSPARGTLPKKNWQTIFGLTDKAPRITELMQ